MVSKSVTIAAGAAALICFSGAFSSAEAACRNTLAPIAAVDSAGGSQERRGHRAQLLQEAAEALRAYVVLKQSLGITDNDMVTKVYGVTPEIWDTMAGDQSSELRR